MRQRSARPAVASLAVAALIGIAGCGGGGGQPTHTFTPTTTQTPPTYSISPAPSPSVPTTGPNVRPGEKPPGPPPGAEQDTPEGAMLFAEFFVETLDWGYATTSSALAREYFTRACTDCETFVSIFDDTRAAHQTFRGGRLSIVSADIAANDQRNGATQAVDVTLTQEKLETVDAIGHIVESDPPAKTTWRFWLAWTSNRWMVVQKGHVVS